MVENGALCPSVTSTFANDLESNEARQYGPSCKRRPGAIWASTWYFGTMTRLRRACVNLQTRQSLRWQLRSWYFLHCPVTTPAQMCRLTRVFAPGCCLRWRFLFYSPGAKTLVSLHICAGVVTGQCNKYQDLMCWQWRLWRVSKFIQARLSLVKVTKYHVLARMAIYCYFVLAAKALASLHICTGLP